MVYDVTDQADGRRLFYGMGPIHVAVGQNVILRLAGVNRQETSMPFSAADRDPGLERSFYLGRFQDVSWGGVPCFLADSGCGLRPTYGEDGAAVSVGEGLEAPYQEPQRYLLAGFFAGGQSFPLHLGLGLGSVWGGRAVEAGGGLLRCGSGRAGRGREC